MLKQIPCSFVVSSQYAAMRLDTALAQIFPEFGVRARRRLWEWCVISVNGTPRSAGYRVSAGDEINIAQSEQKLISPDYVSDVLAATPLEQSIKLIACIENITAFTKPSGIHTATIQGSMEHSCECYIREHWEDLWRKWGAEREDYHYSLPPPCPDLVTRLDKETSGILLAADVDGKKFFRIWESDNQVTKIYFALVCGNLNHSLRIGITLDVENTQQSKPILHQTNFTRSTDVMPLKIFRCGSEIYSLVRVIIHRGARHQIRAHLAYAGYPLWGDRVYTEFVEDLEEPQKEALSHCVEQVAQVYIPVEAVKSNTFDLLRDESKVQSFFLHHAEVILAGRKISFPPEWGWLTPFCVFS